MNVVLIDCDALRPNETRTSYPARAVNEHWSDFRTTVTMLSRVPVSPSGVVTLAKDIDVVVLHRPYTRVAHAFARWLRRQRPSVGLVAQFDEGTVTTYAARVTALADVVVIAEPYIAQMLPAARHRDRIVVIRDGVPEAHLHEIAEPLRSRWQRRDPLRSQFVGWSQHEAALEDLRFVRDAVQKHVNGDAVRLRVIGNGDNVARVLGIDESAVEMSRRLPPQLRRLAISELNMALLPMQPTLENRASSRRRALELTAAGVPVIATRTPELTHLQRSGCPIWLVENTQEEWLVALTLMLDRSWSEMKKLTESHREFVRRYATLEKTLSLWPDAWRRASCSAVQRSAQAVW